MHEIESSKEIVDTDIDDCNTMGVLEMMENEDVVGSEVGDIVVLVGWSVVVGGELTFEHEVESLNSGDEISRNGGSVHVNVFLPLMLHSIVAS